MRAPCSQLLASKRKAIPVSKPGLFTGLLGLIITLIPALASAHDVSEEARIRMSEGGYLDYMWTGAEHMLTGYDHLLFLLGVMFFLSRFIDIFKFVTAFTIGHTITLTFATFAGITANHYLIDAVIAVTVAYKGFENLNGFPRWVGTAAPNLLIMVFVFGLIHGFGLSARLQDLTLANDPDLLVKILLFNVGVEGGQIAALVVMGFAIQAWRQVDFWPVISRVVNAGLIFTGFLLLLFQLHGYVHEAGLIHEHAPAPATATEEGWHSHDGGPMHRH